MVVVVVVVVVVAAVVVVVAAGHSPGFAMGRTPVPPIGPPFLQGPPPDPLPRPFQNSHEQPSILVYKEFKSCWTWKAKTL